MNKPKKKYEAQVIQLPTHVSRLYLVQDIVLYSIKPKPNWFRRFWLWVFFGWRWEDCPKNEANE